jgi:hypothetical protein
MNIDDKLAEVFDLPVSEGELITVKQEVIAPVDDSIEYDYNKTRNNLHTLLHTGTEALDYMLDIAKQSENPRAFEVLSNMMKNMADINHQLVDLHDKKQKLTGVKEKETSKVTQNNAIFVGSTAELSKYLDTMKGE